MNMTGSFQQCNVTILTRKQEAHGPHLSREEIVTCFYYHFKNSLLSPLLERGGSLYEQI